MAARRIPEALFAKKSLIEKYQTFSGSVSPFDTHGGHDGVIMLKGRPSDSPKYQTNIPVSCVKQGRQSYRIEVFGRGKKKRPD